MCYDRKPVHTEQYKGYTIEIWQDQDPQDPYSDGDYMYPMMVSAGRNGSDHDYLDASEAFYPSTAQYRRHKKALLAELEVVPEVDDSPQDIENAVHEAISQAVKNHEFEKLESVGRILGVPCLNTSTTGYSQGDYCNLLVVWTPEWGKKTGVTKKMAMAENYKQMEHNADYWGAWAWGDVYGFVVKDPDGNDIDDGSVWGFVETDPFNMEKAYVMQEARNVVDTDIKWKLKEHLKKLKVHITNRVPLQYREHYKQPRA